MCGILGFSGHVREGQWAETYSLLNALFINSQQRGVDASGFVARCEPFKHPMLAETVMGKQPIPAAEFLTENPAWLNLKHRRCNVVLGHVRWATHGDPADNRTNHPLVAGSLYLVHNGILHEHRKTAETFGLTLKTDCDSELILRFVEHADHPAVGLAHALKKVQGSMAAVVYDGQRDALYMARDSGRPLWLMRLRNDRRWWFASTREILLTAFQEVFGEDVTPKTEILMPLAPDTVCILARGRMMGLPNGDKR